MCVAREQTRVRARVYWGECVCVCMRMCACVCASVCVCSALFEFIILPVSGLIKPLFPRYTDEDILTGVIALSNSEKFALGRPSAI